MRLNYRKLIIHARRASQLAPSKEQEYFVPVTRREVLLIKCFFALGYSHSGIYKKYFGFGSRHSPYYAADGTIFFDKQAATYDAEQVKKLFKRDPAYLQTVAERSKVIGQELTAYGRRIKKTDFLKKSESELKLVTQKFFDLMSEMSSYLALPLSIQGWLEDRLRRYITEHNPVKRAAEAYFQILASPDQQITGFYEQMKVLEMACEYEKNRLSSKLERALARHLFDYDCLGVKYGLGNLWTKKDVLERIKYAAKHHSEQKFKHLRSLPSQQRANTKKALQELGASKEFRVFVKVIQTYIWLRTYRTDVLGNGFANAFPLFDAIARRTGRTRQDVLESTPDEALNFVLPTRNFIQRRAKTVLVSGKNSKVYCLHGRRAVGLLKQLKKSAGALSATSKKVTVIKGDIANSGKARGLVRVVRDNTEVGKVRQGDILVAAMTTPDFIAAMERASAFVTDEGGILSHAAIVSRELGKPCIIGTKIATQVLKDGDRVEVDAIRGVVRKI